MEKSTLNRLYDTKRMGSLDDGNKGMARELQLLHDLMRKESACKVMQTDVLCISILMILIHLWTGFPYD